MEKYRCKMLKDTCLIALKRKDQSPHIFALEILVYMLLKSLYNGSKMNSPNAQAYNHTNGTIIWIGIAWREKGCDPENFGGRITWFEVTVEKIWRIEVVCTKLKLRKSHGLKLEFWKACTGIFVNTECVEGFFIKRTREIWNLDEV
jgi:hypothetical protein